MGFPQPAFADPFSGPRTWFLALPFCHLDPAYWEFTVVPAGGWQGGLEYKIACECHLMDEGYDRAFI